MKRYFGFLIFAFVFQTVSAQVTSQDFYQEYLNKTLKEMDYSFIDKCLKEMSDYSDLNYCLKGDKFTNTVSTPSKDATVITVKISEEDVFVFYFLNLLEKKNDKFSPSKDILAGSYRYNNGIKDPNSIKFFYINRKRVHPSNNIFTEEIWWGEKLYFVLENKTTFKKLIFPNVTEINLNYSVSKTNTDILLPIIVNDKYGYINSSGKIIINPIYELAHDYNKEGTAIVVKNKEYFLINKKGEKVSGSYQLMQSEKCGVIQTINGGTVSNFYGSNAVSGGKVGYIDLKGKTVIENGRYEQIGWQGSGAFEYWPHDEIKVNDKYGVINNKGVVVIEPIYEEVKLDCPLRFARVKFNKKYGIIDFDGNIKVPINYTEIVGPFADGFVFAKNDNGTVLINKSGQIVKKLPAKFLGKCDDGVCLLYDYDLKKIAISDTMGNAITGFVFDKISSFEKNDLAMFTDIQNKKVGFINRKGEIIIPAKYDMEKYGSSDLSDGLIAVKKKDKFGFIDYKGNEVIDFKFDKASDFEKEHSVVKINNKFGLINKKGEYIIEPIYDTLDYDKWTMLCKIINGKQFDKRKIGVFSIQLKKVIIDPKFDDIDFLDEKYIRGKYTISNSPPVIYRYGLFNLDGGEILPPIYNEVEIIQNLIRVIYRYEGSIQDKQISYLNSKGDWIYK